MGLSGGPIWSVIIWLINKIRRQKKQETNLSIMSMITDWTGQHEVLLPISHYHYIFGKKIHLGQTSLVETMSKEKKFPRFFFQDKWLFLWLLWSILWLLLLSDYNCTEFVKNETANAPITFEEIIMVMIKTSMREYSKVKK